MFKAFILIFSVLLFSACGTSDTASKNTESTKTDTKNPSVNSNSSKGKLGKEPVDL